MKTVALYFILNRVVFFSCFCKKRTKRSRLKEALSRLLPQSKSPSLRIHPTRIADSAEHLNLDPVHAENVPIFCMKFGAFNIGRAAMLAGASISAPFKLISLVPFLFSHKKGTYYRLSAGGSEKSPRGGLWVRCEPGTATIFFENEILIHFGNKQPR